MVEEGGLQDECQAADFVFARYPEDKNGPLFYVQYARDERELLHF